MQISRKFCFYLGDQKMLHRNVLKVLDYEIETALGVPVMSEDPHVRDDGWLQRAWPGESGV